jgi:hypothetical protein
MHRSIGCVSGLHQLKRNLEEGLEIFVLNTDEKERMKTDV